MKGLISTFKQLNRIESISYMLLAISLFGLFIFQMTSTVLVSLYPGMNYIKDAISILVYVPYGWMQTIAFYIFGISLLSLALVLQFKMPVKFNLGAILLVLMGYGFFLIGTCPAQISGAPATLTGNIHHWATIAVVMIFPLACFLIARIFKDHKFRYLHIYTIAVGIFQLVFIFLGGYLFGDLTGIYERILLWNGQIWIIVICFSLLLFEIKDRMPGKSWNQIVTRFFVYGSIFAYCTLIWPLCLPLIANKY